MRAARRQLISCVREMAARGLVVGTLGNASVRLADRVLITPSRVSYERMRRRDLVAVGSTGERPGGSPAPSRELPLHLAVYRRRPDVAALVHTHSPHAVAWSFLEEPLPATEEARYYGIGEVRTNPPAEAGSEALAETAAVTLGGSAAVLLGRHGLLAAAATLPEALEIATVVEHQARVALLLQQSPVAADSPGRRR